MVAVSKTSEQLCLVVSAEIPLLQVAVSGLMLGGSVPSSNSLSIGSMLGVGALNFIPILEHLGAHTCTWGSVGLPALLVVVVLKIREQLCLVLQVAIGLRLGGSVSSSWGSVGWPAPPDSHRAAVIIFEDNVNLLKVLAKQVGAGKKRAHKFILNFYRCKFVREMILPGHLWMVMEKLGMVVGALVW